MVPVCLLNSDSLRPSAPLSGYVISAANAVLQQLAHVTNSAPRYILGLTTQITPCSPRPDAVMLLPPAFSQIYGRR